MNPINPYGSSVPGPSHGPEDNKDDPLRGVGGSSRFTRRGAIRGQKGVRGASEYLESRVGRTGGKKAHEAAAKILGLGKKIKESGERAGAVVSGAASGVGTRIATTVKQIKGKIQEKIGGKKEKKTPEQIKMKNLAKEAKARVGKLVPGGKRTKDMYKPEPLGKPFKIPRPEVKIDDGSSSFSPDLGAIGGKRRVKLPRAKVSTGKDGSSKAEGTRKSERLEGKKNKGILKQPGPKTGGKGGIRWADQEGRSLEEHSDD